MKIDTLTSNILFKELIEKCQNPNIDSLISNIIHKKSYFIDILQFCKENNYLIFNYNFDNYNKIIQINKLTLKTKNKYNKYLTKVEYDLCTDRHNCTVFNHMKYDAYTNSVSDIYILGSLFHKLISIEKCK